MLFANAPKAARSGTSADSSTRIDTVQAAVELFCSLRQAPREVAAFAYLDPDWMLLGLRHVPTGGNDSVRLSIRDIAADAIIFGASNVVMAHNHPSGDPAPSSADLDATRRIARALAALEVRLIDHVIVARHGHSSFRSLGLL